LTRNHGIRRRCKLLSFHDYLLLKVSASFAASLVTSPAIGAYLGRAYSDNLVIALASFVAILDVCFVLLAVPESLPEKCRPATWGSHIAWDKADPFAVNSRLATLAVWNATVLVSGKLCVDCDESAGTPVN